MFKQQRHFESFVEPVRFKFSYDYHITLYTVVLRSQQRQRQPKSIHIDNVSLIQPNGYHYYNNDIIIRIIINIICI